MPPGGADGPFDVAAGVARVRRRISDAGGDPARIRVVAVTKGFGHEAVLAALAAGVVDVGENYAQELLAKDAAVRDASEVDPGIRWHFLGAVQRNKVAALAPVVACWQTVARVVEGDAIARRHGGAAVLVEVDTTGAAGRNGCHPADVPDLVSALRAFDLDVRGLMTVAPPGPEDVRRRAFKEVAALADDLGLVERSMGMSDDLEIAVAEGSTMVRVGRALFGDRPPRRVTAM